MEESNKAIQKLIGEISREKEGSHRQERLIDELLPILRKEGLLKDWLDLYEQLPVRHDVVREAREKIDELWASAD